MKELDELSQSKVEWYLIKGRIRGVTIPDTMGEESIWNFILSLNKFDEGTPIAMGDALVALDRFVPQKPGETPADHQKRCSKGRSKYEERMATTGLAYDTLARRCSVCRSVPIWRRRQTTTFGHMVEVAPLSEGDQVKFLSMADERGLSVAKLRREIRQSKKKFQKSRPPPIGFDLKSWINEGVRHLSGFEGWPEDLRSKTKVALAPLLNLIKEI